MDQDTLFDQLTTMTKAHAYDNLSQDYEKIKNENKRLRDRVKFLEDLINEYTEKILSSLNKK